MKIAMLFAAAALLPGCMSIQAAFHYPMTYPVYKKDGFVVNDDFRVFTFEAEKNLSILEVVKRCVYVDEESDGVVDRIEIGTAEYVRGELGTIDLFRDADTLWKRLTDYMSIPYFKRKWETMDPAEIVATWQKRRHAP
ncbi:MAG: hypothetical protein ACYTFG_03300 [Planctomycetota bacterium]|jgi:hypothetical protein